MNLLNQNIYEGITPSGKNEIPGWNSYHSIFKNLIQEVKPKIIIEVGTWLGASAINMAKISKSLGLETKIFCVDTWLGAQEFWTWGKDTPDRDLKLKNGYPQVYFDFLSNVVQHEVQDRIIPVPCTSSIGRIVLEHYGIKADLAYIDGSHEYLDVKVDIANYLTILNSDGVIFGDDLNWPGVNQAVNESFKSYKTLDPFWIHRPYIH